jgi:hypothetical protein
VRRYTTPLLTGIAAGLVIAFVALGQNDARALESFELNEHDHILAESPGCHLECRVLAGTLRRTCVVRDFDCKAVCMDVPECSTAGRTPPRVCAIMRTKR